MSEGQQVLLLTLLTLILLACTFCATYLVEIRDELRKAAESEELKTNVQP